MAVYQLNYGFTSDGTPEPTKPAGGVVNDQFDFSVIALASILVESD